MFWRILWRLLWASRSRLVLALVAVTAGAAVCAALVNLDLDAGEKLTREFRSLGANVVVSPAQSAGTGSTMDSGVMNRIESLRAPEIIAAAPYLYVVAQAGPQSSEKNAPAPSSVIVAGTWFDQVASINSWWSITGQRITERDDPSECMVGQEAARSLGLMPGSQLTLRSGGREATLKVAGVVTSGGSEDSQVFVDLATAQNLAGLDGHIGLVQLSVRGSTPVIENVIHRLSDALPEIEVQPVRQLAAADGRLLDRIRGLLFATVALILVLTALGVLAAMAGLALERRRDVGMMKALGGTVRRVMRFFLAEAAVIGILGGIVGWAAGMLLADIVGEQVFATSISPRLIVLPVTVGLMIAVALAGALPLRLLGRVRPAEILRGE
jgi:putative ABC transport system permease protein